MIIPSKIIRSNRKTMCLVITPKGEFIVRAPNKMSLATINEFIAQKESWIVLQQHKAVERVKKAVPLEVKSGEAISLLGREYTLDVGSYGEVLLAGDIIRIPAGENQVETLVNWLKTFIYDYIVKRVSVYKEIMGLSPTSVKISNAKSRWGSCSGKNGLRFSWRLVFTPPHVVDYLVVHELAHIKERNHSRAYWSVVERVLPSYKEDQQWLKENTQIMGLF